MRLRAYSAVGDRCGGSGGLTVAKMVKYAVSDDGKNGQI